MAEKERAPVTALSKVYRLLRKTPAHLTLQAAASSSRPFLAAALHKNVGTPILVVTSRQSGADQFREELGFFLSSGEALPFPAWEVLPFEPLSPAPEISAARLDTLLKIMNSSRPVVVAPLEAALQLLVPKWKMSGAHLVLRPGETVILDQLQQRLDTWGYSRSETVTSLGEYARRGGILDFFPPPGAAPVRIELFGSEVDSIRFFDPETQRNLDLAEEVTVLPAREIFLDRDVLEKLRQRMKKAGEPTLEGESLRQKAEAIPGFEHFLPALLRSRETLLDYFTSPPLVLLDEFPDLEERAAALKKEVADGAANTGWPYLSDTERAYLDFDRWLKYLGDYSTVYLDRFGLSPECTQSFPVNSTSGRSFVLGESGGGSNESPLQSVIKKISEAQRSERILLVARSTESAGRLRSLFAEQGLGTAEAKPGEIPALLFGKTAPMAPRIAVGPVSEGFRYPAAKLLIISEEDIFGTKYRRQPHGRGGSKSTGQLFDFSLLRPGDHLVHLDHGIGQYRGLTRMPAGEEETDFLVIAYEGGDLVYVPIHNLDCVQPYISWEGREPKVGRLGAKAWKATKRKAKKELVTMARDLLRLYAVRHSTRGHAFAPDTTWQSEFELAFEFEETKDQLRAVEEIKEDMEQPFPMDRLVCGDVGYGKTEVAMRAAFKAAMDSKQVALLAPTTVLVQQHLTTFRKRFASYPVRTEMLSRFVGASRQKQIVADLAAGNVDVVIGTHRLLRGDIRFHDLGLLIVDEEQRFGVRHKESLKKLRETVDVLTLTATPIPRTLYLSMAGIRELSRIATPPEDRHAIQTVVTSFDRDLIREAILRELRRGGQIFFLHNRVQSIEGIASYLRQLVPEARTDIAHGQMGGRRLEDVMLRFRAGDFDMMVCTTIVESGLDIPNANTMFINKADTFGLADLYQLRGRIGRSRHRAYAYLLVSGGGMKSAAAHRRIEAIRDFSSLGAGFQIALHDLEIRGAGSAIGYRQSGHIAAIGFELYTRLLRETIGELQGQPASETRPVQVSLTLPTYIPEGYVEDINQRLVIYKKIAAAEDGGKIDEIGGELRERFGPLPKPAYYLLRAARLRQLATEAGVAKFEWRKASMAISFHPDSAVSAEILVDIARETNSGSPGDPTGLLLIQWKSSITDERFDQAEALLQQLR